MSDSLLSLAAVLAAFFVVAVSPGPATLACASVAMSRGWRAGFAMALGLSLGLGVWGILAATGLGALLAASAAALGVLKVLGGLYLLWLAWGAAISARAVPARIGEDAQGSWFRRGLMLNLLNPKAVLAWMAVLVVGFGPESAAGWIILATALCVLLGLGIYTLIAVAFSRPGMMTAYARARRLIEVSVAALFAAAGLGLLRSALVR